MTALPVGYLTSPDILDQIAEFHRTLATEQPQRCGLLDQDGPGSWTHPDLSRILYADGKVVTPAFRAKPGDKVIDKTTGEIHWHCCVERSRSVAHRCGLVFRSDRFGEFIECCRNTSTLVARFDTEFVGHCCVDGSSATRSVPGCFVGVVLHLLRLRDSGSRGT